MNAMESALDVALGEARLGHQEGYAELWRRLSPAVCGYLRAKGASDPEALTNDAFLGAFDALSAFVGDGAQFRGLLFTIAQRRLMDDFRRRARRPAEVEWDAALDERLDESAEHRALASQDETDARALLDGLPQDQRDVMLLRIFGDLTVEQVAATVGKSPGAVKALQRRALENLRRRVAGASTPEQSDMSTGGPKR
jgi:RNA polymerase sigma factor (sigma-70 family)